MVVIFFLDIASVNIHPVFLFFPPFSDDQLTSLFQETESLAMFSEFISSTLEILNACLAPQNIEGNAHLIYWLLHRHNLLEPFHRDPVFGHIVHEALNIVRHFSHCVDESGVKHGSVDDILRVRCLFL